jgi:uncharacterized protein
VAAADDNAAIVLRALGAFRAQDYETLRSLLAPDVVWTIPGISRISGDRQGTEAVAAQLQTIAKAGVNVEVLDVLAGAQHVATLQRNTARDGDRALDILVVNLFEVRDGEVASMRTFPSDLRALEAFWA